MSLEQLFQTVERGLFNFGRQLCRDRRAEVREESETVSANLQRERAALRRCRDELAQLRQRVKANEGGAAYLASRIESYVYVHDGPSAYDHAIKLDQVRHRLAEDRAALRRALADERDSLEAIRDLERRYDELQDQLSRT
jgi:hypothetical protein